MKCVGKYIGNRPCKLKRSNWKARDDAEKEDTASTVQFPPYKAKK